MVAEQVLTYGSVERTAWLLLFVNVSVMKAGRWTVAAMGPDESSCVDLVTRDLDVYTIDNLPQVLARVFPSSVQLV